MNGKNPVSAMRDEVMKDLYGKVEYHTKQRELY
jgi:hypothetical protein